MVPHSLCFMLVMQTLRFLVLFVAERLSIPMSLGLLIIGDEGYLSLRVCSTKILIPASLSLRVLFKICRTPSLLR